MPLPSSPAPPSGSSASACGAWRATISRFAMKPPVASTTPRRARRWRSAPARRPTTPTMRPSPARTRERAHQHRAARAAPLGAHRVPARRRARELAVGVRLLAARVPEAVVGPRLEVVRPVARLERDRERAEPVEVLDAALAVEAELLEIGRRARRRAQVGEHLLRGVVEPAGLLHRGAPAAVEDAARRGGRAAAGARALEHEGGRAGARGLDRGAGPGAAEPDDEDVGA